MAWIKVYERKGGRRYQVRWRGPDGRTRTRMFDRAADARSLQSSIEHDLDRGTYAVPSRGRISLREAWEAFIGAPPRPLTAKTESIYRLHWRLRIEPRLGDRRINTLTPEDVRMFLRDLSEANVGAASIDSTHRLLRRILSVAVQDRRIVLNPAAGISAPKARRREMRFLTAEELERLADQVPAHYRALIGIDAAG